MAERTGGRRRGRRTATVLALAVSALVVAGCAGSDSAAPPKKRIVYDAIGASESAGYGADEPLSQAWPVVLWKTALPDQTTFHNYGIPGATVKDALAEELPKALADQPTLATVWLNVNDMLELVSVSTYETQLDDLVHQIRRGGATKVLVANVPPLDHLPSYLGCRPNPPPNSVCTQKALGLIPPSVINGFVSNFNAAIARVVQKEGAILVDLHAAGLAARADGTEAAMVGADGFHPSTAGHKAVAATFAKALADSGGP